MLPRLIVILSTELNYSQLEMLLYMPKREFLLICVSCSKGVQ